MGHYASEMDGSPGPNHPRVEQGPAPAPRPPAPYDFSRFDVLLAGLQDWRSDDHEDNITLCRSHVIEIIEGVKALRR
jgi:hypothetical protein